MKKFVLFALAACILAACAPKEEYSAAPSAKKFYASMEPATRTFTEDGNVYWINVSGYQDKVSIFYKNAENVAYGFEGNTGETQGELAPVGDAAVEGTDFNYIYSFYPYATYNEIWGEGELYGYLSPGQYYFEDSFGIYGMNPMAAVSDNESLEFKNLAGYLKLRLYGDSSTSLSSITITTNGGEYIAGDIVVNIAPGEEPVIESYDEAGYANTEITLSFESASEPVVLDASKPTDIWFCLIPGTISSGITVSVTGKNGTTFEYSSSNPLTIKRGVCTATAPLKVEFPELKYLGKGKLTDGNLFPLFGEDDVTVDCDVYEYKDIPGMYVIGGYQLAMAIALYSDQATAQEIEEEYEDVIWTESYFSVNATDKSAVTIAAADYGIWTGSTYGWAQIRSLNPGTMNGLNEITWPVKGLLVGLDDGWYYGNKYGTFKITIPASIPKPAPAAAPATKSNRRSGNVRELNSFRKLEGEKVASDNFRPLCK